MRINLYRMHCEMDLILFVKLLLDGPLAPVTSTRRVTTLTTWYIVLYYLKP